MLYEVGRMISPGWIPKIIFGIGIAFLTAGLVRQEDWMMISGTLAITGAAISKWDTE